MLKKKKKAFVVQLLLPSLLSQLIDLVHSAGNWRWLSETGGRPSTQPMSVGAPHPVSRHRHTKKKDYFQKTYYTGALFVPRYTSVYRHTHTHTPAQTLALNITV